MAGIGRIARHLFATHWQIRRVFPKKTLDAIAQEIEVSEVTHDGQIRFVVECALSGIPLFRGISARERAIDVFSHLRMWNTEQRNGVLVYLLYADRSVEIVADRGVHDKTGSHEWESICHSMEAAFRADKFEEGAIAGIRAITRLLALHYPGTGASRNELPNTVVLL